MKRLSVLYDNDCAMCRRCRDWLAHQATFVDLEFVSLQSPDLNRRFPGIDPFDPREKLIVVSDDGSLYLGATAWVMCLWALQKYRGYAVRLSDPLLLPFARFVCELLSRNRYAISRLIFRQDTPSLGRDLARLDSPADCRGGGRRLCK